MPKDVLITPGSGLIDFKDTGGTSDATIQLNDSGDLIISNPAGNISLGNTAAHIYVGDGTSSVDIIFEQNGAVRALASKTLTLGQSTSFITVAAPTTFASTASTLTFASANPTISASSYINFPGGAYFNSGVVYTEAQLRARGGIGNDTAATLSIAGGTSGTTVFTGAGNVVINSTTASTGATTGALVVKGGVGVAGLIVGKAGTGGAATNSNDLGSLSVRGDNTNAAVISFHRPSVYAINMGLDTDNVFKIGGWSATANCFQLTGAGALTLTGGITTAGHIVPSANLTYNLGSTTAWWNNVYGVSVQAKYADLAEHYTADDLYGPGTVVVFGGEQEITTTDISHDPRVAGVISTNPAYLMNAASAGLPVALTGRVPCQVQGPVFSGQVLVTSTTVGAAQGIDNTQFVPGCVIGKALESINTDTIETIEVVVGRF